MLSFHWASCLGLFRLFNTLNNLNEWDEEFTQRDTQSSNFGTYELLIMVFCVARVRNLSLLTTFPDPGLVRHCLRP